MQSLTVKDPPGLSPTTFQLLIPLLLKRTLASLTKHCLASSPFLCPILECLCLILSYPKLSHLLRLVQVAPTLKPSSLLQCLGTPPSYVSAELLIRTIHSALISLSLTHAHTALPGVQSLFPNKWEAHCLTSSLGQLTGISNLTYSGLNLTILSRSLNEDCNVANFQVT